MPSPDARQNRLLALLPQQDFERLRPHLEPVQLALGESIYESGEQPEHVLFPTTAIVSLIYILESGLSAELASVGNEGMVGISLLLGGQSTPSLAVVQTAGQAYRLPGNLLKAEFDRAGFAQRLLLRYTQVLVTQVSQTAICNRGHSVEQQLCRWLLSTLDRLETRELVMTHELVANALGVRREGISDAACKLRRAGIVSYRRGHISVLKRPELEARACECHAVVKRELNRLLTAIP
ncbi:Crp/Fnr family transcriptional regulator [Sinimarinibacterium flocculans]|uniref:Crp/Fnr family transcriptional regulator n=1 Tax=Sinimarinibacterium flocculans TaxID=985250 RepID=UPI00249218E8|nr:Crp/Fnr family transcriptional regulator [Sinimarinibacterium flocculans]